MVLTCKILNFNNYFYVWFGSDVSKYSNKVSLIRSVSKKENLTYKEASALVNNFLTNQSSIEKRINELEKENTDFFFLKTKYQQTIKTKENSIKNQKVKRLIKKIRKELDLYLKSNEVIDFKFSYNKIQEGKVIKKVNKLNYFLKKDNLKDRYTLNEYIILLNTSIEDFKEKNKEEVISYLNRYITTDKVNCKPYKLFLTHFVELLELSH